MRLSGTCAVVIAVAVTAGTGLELAVVAGGRALPVMGHSQRGAGVASGALGTAKLHGVLSHLANPTRPARRLKKNWVGGRGC